MLQRQCPLTNFKLNIFYVKLKDTYIMNAYKVLIHRCYCYVNIHSIGNVNFVDNPTPTPCLRYSERAMPGLCHFNKILKICLSVNIEYTHEKKQSFDLTTLTWL